MNERLKKAFDQIHAEEEIKHKTKAFVMNSVQSYEKRKKYNYRRLAPVLACLLLLAIAFGSYHIYFIPVSAVSIDINPSLELEINRFDRVVSVTGYNSDGQALASTLDVRFKTYKEALEQILESESLKAYRLDGEELFITVVSSDEIRCSEIFSEIETCTEENPDIRCYTASPEDAELAHASGMSCGKYRAYMELKELDPEVTVDEVQGMTMKEIHNCIEEGSGGAGNSDGSHGGYGHKNGHGGDHK